MTAISLNLGALRSTTRHGASISEPCVDPKPLSVTSSTGSIHGKRLTVTRIEGLDANTDLGAATIVFDQIRSTAFLLTSAHARLHIHLDGIPCSHSACTILTTCVVIRLT